MFSHSWSQNLLINVFCDFAEIDDQYYKIYNLSECFIKAENAQSVWVIFIYITS